VRAADAGPAEQQVLVASSGRAGSNSIRRIHHLFAEQAARTRAGADLRRQT
jgi:hypothetical protein